MFSPLWFRLKTGVLGLNFSFLIKLVVRVGSRDPEPFLSYTALGRGCWRLPVMRWVFFLHLSTTLSLFISYYLSLAFFHRMFLSCLTPLTSNWSLQMAVPPWSFFLLRGSFSFPLLPVLNLIKIFTHVEFTLRNWKVKDCLWKFVLWCASLSGNT